MSEWHSITLGELVALQRGHDLPNSERCAGAVPVAGSGGIVGFHNQAKAPGPGVTIGRAANIGVPSLIREDFWPLNTTLYVTDFRGNDVRFVYYLFRTLDLSGYNSGSVQPMLNRNFIKNVIVKIPGLREQQRISSVLGTLDDKIDLNNRIATAARDLSLAILAGATSGDSDTIRLSDAASYINRGQSPKYVDDPEELLLINQKCVRNGRVTLDPARNTEGRRTPGEKLLQKYDVLVNSTGVGTLGRVGIWSHDLAATVDSHVTIVRFKPALPPIIGALALARIQPQIAVLGEGSTGQTELSRAKLASVEIQLPTHGLDGLATQLSAIEARADAALSESVALARLRDTLLPELITGRLTVNKIDSQ